MTKLFFWESLLQVASMAREELEYEESLKSSSVGGENSSKYLISSASTSPAPTPENTFMFFNKEMGNQGQYYSETQKQGHSYFVPPTTSTCTLPSPSTLLQTHQEMKYYVADSSESDTAEFLTFWTDSSNNSMSNTSSSLDSSEIFILEPNNNNNYYNYVEKKKEERTRIPKFVIPKSPSSDTIRSHHNKNERSRRAKLRECFLILKKETHGNLGRISNSDILAKALYIISLLKSEEEELEKLLFSLRKEHLRLVKRLDKLTSGDGRGEEVMDLVCTEQVDFDNDLCLGAGLQ